MPLFFASAAKGASFLIGEAGISIPRLDIFGMINFYFYVILNNLFSIEEVPGKS
jgi:hypothetical protein